MAVQCGTFSAAYPVLESAARFAYSSFMPDGPKSAPLHWHRLIPWIYLGLTIESAALH
jgi:hypothetical protein